MGQRWLTFTNPNWSLMGKSPAPSSACSAWSSGANGAPSSFHGSDHSQWSWFLFQKYTPPNAAEPPPTKIKTHKHYMDGRYLAPVHRYIISAKYIRYHLTGVLLHMPVCVSRIISETINKGLKGRFSTPSWLESNPYHGSIGLGIFSCIRYKMCPYQLSMGLNHRYKGQFFMGNWCCNPFSGVVTFSTGRSPPCILNRAGLFSYKTG